MSTAKLVLICCGGGLTFSHVINIATGHVLWWWVIATYAALAGFVIWTRLRKPTV